MRKTVLAAVILIATGCGGDTASETTAPETSTTAADTDSTTTVEPVATTAAATTTTEALSTTSAAPTTTLPVGGLALIRIDEIVFAGEPYLLISNRGDGAGSTEGHFICQFPAYYELPAIELLPGERLAVPLAEGDVPELIGVVATVDVTSPIGTIAASNGELGLYSRNEFNSADAIIDYVEWGSSDHARSGVAVDAGIWVEGGFVEVPPEMLAIVTQAFPTVGPEDWFAEIGG